VLDGAAEGRLADITLIDPVVFSARKMISVDPAVKTSIPAGLPKLALVPLPSM